MSARDKAADPTPRSAAAALGWSPLPPGEVGRRRLGRDIRWLTGADRETLAHELPGLLSHLRITLTADAEATEEPEPMCLLSWPWRPAATEAKRPCTTTI
jgi:hypothetical protein